MKRTKIVCTIGPASESEERLKQLMELGMNVCRLNFSHGDHDEHLERINNIKKVRKQLGVHTAIMLDTKGPEIRLGKFKDGMTVRIEQGQDFTFTTRQDQLGDQNIVSISYEDLPKDVEVGSRILVDDGLVEFVVNNIEGTEIHTKAINYGEIKDRKGLNAPGIKISLPALTDKDISDIKFGVENGIDFIAASFIRKPEDVLAIREVLEECGGEHVHIISKIESEEGVDNLDSIIEVSDGIMVARGDLGVEVSNERVPLVQKEIIRKCNLLGKPVITATQMLDSMIRNPRPTRAEVNDVANAILDGSDAIMLSGETAAGKYPDLAVETMRRIALHIETSIDYKKGVEVRKSWIEHDPTNAISNSVSRISEQLNAAAIVAATTSGTTARAISKFRPETNIVATTHVDNVARKLSLVWGVTPILTKKIEATDELIDNSISEALKNKFISEGDLIVLSAGIPASTPGSTNMLKVHTVANVLTQGQPIGKGSVVSRACVVKDAEELKTKFKEGDIIVSEYTDADMVTFIEKSAGIIVKQGGLTSHAAITALNYKLPAIIGVDTEDKIKDGQLITLDANAGFVYEGAARVM